MAKTVASLQFCSTNERDAELIRLINKVADIEHRSPHNLARYLLLTHLRAAIDQHNATRNPEGLKTAV